MGRVSRQTERDKGGRLDNLTTINYLWWFDGALNRLGHDEEADEQQEQAIDKAGQDLGPNVAVGEALVGLPFGDNGRGQTGQESRAVEEHVE